MICDYGDIVIVPFPFVDSPQSKRRPALVLSRKAFNDSHRHTLLAMITTGGGASWESDIPIETLAPTGLPVPSLIRMKLFTLDNRFIIKSIGHLNTKDKKQVRTIIRNEVLG